MNIISNTYDNVFYIVASVNNNIQTTQQFNYEDNNKVGLIRVNSAAVSSYTSNQQVFIQSDQIPNIVLYKS